MYDTAIYQFINLEVHHHETVSSNLPVSSSKLVDLQSYSLSLFMFVLHYLMCTGPNTVCILYMVTYPNSVSAKLILEIGGKGAIVISLRPVPLGYNNVLQSLYLHLCIKLGFCGY